MMNLESIEAYIVENFEGVDVDEDEGSRFFIYDPERKFEGAGRIPFATLTISDKYDDVSDLDREGVYRLNVGLTKETFRGLFAQVEGGAEREWDYTTFDVVMPHPQYGMMYWVCVVCPSEATFEAFKGYLRESYEIAVGRSQKGGGGW